jgi:large subunit ribosomal protein L13
MEKTEFTIDAKGKRLGKIATEVASLLLGKNRTDSEKHIATPVTVTVVNARLLDISEKKSSQETYQTYSGYPGGQKIETLGALSRRRGYGEALRRSIGGMLPKNKLHKVRMKNLIVTE